MGYYEQNCSECDNYFGDQCSRCAAIERENKENEPCQFSDGQVAEKDCGLSFSSIKRDSCGKCGYIVNY